MSSLCAYVPDVSDCVVNVEIRLLAVEVKNLVDNVKIDVFRGNVVFENPSVCAFSKAARAFPAKVDDGAVFNVIATPSVNRGASYTESLAYSCKSFLAP